MFLVEYFRKWDRVNGVSYHACTITTADKKRLHFETDSESNVRGGLMEYFGDWAKLDKGCFEVTHDVMGSRDFNRRFKGAAYLGCTAEEIAEKLSEILGPST